MAVLDIVVPFAAVVLFALWELWRLRRPHPGAKTTPRDPARGADERATTSREPS